MRRYLEINNLHYLTQPIKEPYRFRLIDQNTNLVNDKRPLVVLKLTPRIYSQAVYIDKLVAVATNKPR